MIRTAVYPGSFDPISNGHIDIIKRISIMFDRVIIVVSKNPNKHYIFSSKERVEMIRSVTKDLPNVSIDESSLLVIDYLKSIGECVLVRGIRNTLDCISEMATFQFNRGLSKEFDTVFLFPSPENVYISSSAIRELALFHDDISRYVPKELADIIVKKIREREKV